MHPSRRGISTTLASIDSNAYAHRVSAAGRQGDWPLTSRETEVLAAMADGKTNASIAEALFVSRRAVEKHVNAIFSKLQLSGRDEQHPRVQAVLIYLGRRPGAPGERPSARRPEHVHQARRHLRGPRRHCMDLSSGG